MSDKFVLAGETREFKIDNCDKCYAPFFDHHHIHITRKGVYHTSCYQNVLNQSDKE